MTSTPQTSNPTLDKIRQLIANWFIIDFKDAQFIKEAKMKARKDLESEVVSLLREVELEARKDEFKRTVMGGEEYSHEDFDLWFRTGMGTEYEYDRIKELDNLLGSK